MFAFGNVISRPALAGRGWFKVIDMVNVAASSPFVRLSDFAEQLNELALRLANEQNERKRDD